MAKTVTATELRGLSREELNAKVLEFAPHYSKHVDEGGD